MHKIKLIILLKSLNKEEFRRLGKFLNSPFYNYAIAPIRLYESLKKFHPAFDSPKMTQGLIWQKVYPNDVLIPNKLWQLTSKLTKLVEQFLLTIELEKHPREKQKFLIKALAPRNKKLLDKTIEEVDNELEEKKKSHAIYQEDFLHQLSLSNFHGIFNTTEAIQYEEKFLDRLELFYLSQKLKSVINLRSVEKHRNRSYTFYLVPEIIQLVESDNFKQFPHLQFFSKLFQLVNDENPTLYYEVKKMFVQLMYTFEKEDKKFVFHHLINYVIYEVSNGNIMLKKENLELYKLGLEFHIIIEDGMISDKTFTTIVSLGASFTEFIWTEKFINKYSNYLSPLSKVDAVTISMGYLSFYKKEYLETIDLLLGFQFVVSIDSIRARGLLTRSYFELYLVDDSYFNFFNSYTNSFEKYLQRDATESESRKQIYLNFIRILKKLAQLKYSKNLTLDSKNKLELRLKKENVVLKSWLLEKIHSI